VWCGSPHLESTDWSVFRQAVTFPPLGVTSPLGGCQHEPQPQRKGERLHVARMAIRMQRLHRDTEYDANLVPV
jgi:hypothetical protein